MNILVTGVCGFIGFHVARGLLQRGDHVAGIDNLNDYYEVSLKQARLTELQKIGNFQFIKADLADRGQVATIFTQYAPSRVIHLAAQAGVRYSLQNPYAYVDSNLVGFVNLIEACRHGAIEHTVYASSSSVYGANKKIPFSIEDRVDRPVSLYAATKKSNELMAHVYSHLFKLPMTGLRFFTVYGPWGRPDMAPFLFAKAILEGKPIDVFNHGNMKRDFTYIDDIVEGVIRVADRIPGGDVPYKLYNIGNHQPVELLRFIELMEQFLGKKAIKNLLPMQPGDVPETFADVTELTQDVGFRPDTTLETGLARFVEWYRSYYGV